MGSRLGSRVLMLPPSPLSSVQEFAVKAVPSASNIDIRRCLESIEGKKLRRGRFLATKPDYKKALVTLQDPLSVSSDTFTIGEILGERERKASTAAARRKAVEAEGAEIYGEREGKHWMEDEKECFSRAGCGKIVYGNPGRLGKKTWEHAKLNKEVTKEGGILSWNSMRLTTEKPARSFLQCRSGSRCSSSIWPPSPPQTPASTQLGALMLTSSTTRTMPPTTIYFGRIFSRPFSSNVRDRGSFEVVEGDNDTFLRQIGIAIDETKHEFNDIEVAKRYEEFVKPQLKCRGLLMPHSMKHKSTPFIHNRSLAIAGHTPKYMSILDIMGHEIRMDEEEWNCFLAYMIKTRVYVVPDSASTLSQVETLFYDYGVIETDDGTGTEMFKADSDASFSDEKQEANLGFLIFKETSIIHCQVHYEVPCKSSVMAEAYAVSALLTKATELGIKKLVVWVDNKDIKRVLSGEYNVKAEDVNHDIFMVLRKQRRAFQKVITIWKERELNQPADDLVSLDKSITLDPTFPRQALDRWRPQLEGRPIFRFKQRSEVKSMTHTFGGRQSYVGGASPVVMLEVGKIRKFDCILGLIDGFDPDDMYVQVHDFENKPEALKLKFMDFFSKARADAVDGISFFHRDCRSGRIGDKRKAILVVFDSNLWEKTSYTSRLTVILLGPEDTDFRGRHNLRKLSSLDYARFSSENK